MPYLYDNIIASVVGATVFLILASIQMRATGEQVAQTARNTALSQTTSLATWLEEDLEAMGRNREAGQMVFGNISRTGNEASPTGEVLTSLTFRYEDDGGDSTTVAYQVEESESRMVAGEERPIYTLNRLQNGSSSGGASTVLGYFDLRFIDGNATRVPNPVANRGEIQALQLHFSVIPSFESDQMVLDEIHRMVVVPYTPAQ
jgi:hypothetical protein